MVAMGRGGASTSSATKQTQRGTHQRKDAAKCLHLICRYESKLSGEKAAAVNSQQQHSEHREPPRRQSRTAADTRNGEVNSVRILEIDGDRGKWTDGSIDHEIGSCN
jgi:hypothetical protein